MRAEELASGGVEGEEAAIAGDVANDENAGGLDKVAEVTGADLCLPHERAAGRARDSGAGDGCEGEEEETGEQAHGVSFVVVTNLRVPQQREVERWAGGEQQSGGEKRGIAECQPIGLHRGSFLSLCGILANRRTSAGQTA